MIGKLYVTCLLLLLYCMLSGQLVNGHLYSFKGSVKSIRDSAFSVESTKAPWIRGNMKGVYHGNDILFFNKNGLLTELHEYDASIYSHTLIGKTVYLYDTAGRLIRVISNGDTTFVRYEFDRKKRITKAFFSKHKEIIKVLVYDHANVVTSSAVFKLYHGYPVEERAGSKRYVNTFDKRGNLTGVTIYERDSGYTRAIYEFDAHNSPVRLSGYDSYTGKTYIIQSYTYEYDARGNWIRKICFEETRPRYIVERTIEYY